jgi:hypothetical protein
MMQDHALPPPGPNQPGGLVPGHSVDLGRCPKATEQAEKHPAEKLREILDSLADAAERLKATAYPALAPLLLGADNWSLATLELGSDLAKLLLATLPINADLLNSPDWNPKAAGELIATGRARDQLRKSLSAIYGGAYQRFPLEKLESQLARRHDSFFAFGWWQVLKAERCMQRAMTNAGPRSHTELAQDLGTVRDLRSLQDILDRAGRIGELFGEHWQASEAEWDLLERQLDWAEQFRAVVQKAEFDTPAQARQAQELWIRLATRQRIRTTREQPLGKAFARFCFAYANFVETRRNVADILAIDKTSPWFDPTKPDAAGLTIAFAKTWKENLSTRISCTQSD